MASSTPFAFDFRLGEESTDKEVSIETKRKNDNESDTAEEVASRRPFAWKDNDETTSIILERSQQEIVFTDISLQDSERNGDIIVPPLRQVDLASSSFADAATIEKFNTTDLVAQQYEGGLKVWGTCALLVTSFSDFSPPL